MLIKCYKQTTYETCLAVSLMLLLDIKPNPKREVAIWKTGWKFNFLIGQLNYASKKYNKELTLYVENKNYCNRLKKEADTHINVKCSKISLGFIERNLRHGAVIIYIDNYWLQKYVHAPHFILLHKMEGCCYKASDPFDGKVKLITKRCLEQAVNSLKKHLKFSPVAISITQEPVN